MQTRGILRPDDLGHAFRLERRPAPADLAHVVDDHWSVSWDPRGSEPYRSEVLTHPAVHLVFEPHGAAVFGVHRQRYERTLAGRGWAVGTKFLPGGFRQRRPCRADLGGGVTGHHQAAPHVRASTRPHQRGSAT